MAESWTTELSPSGWAVGARDDRPAGRADVDRSVGIVAVAAGLMALGAVMTFSASASVDRSFSLVEFWKSPALRQIVFVIGGLTAMLIMRRVPYRIWASRRGGAAWLLILAGLGGVALTFVEGIGLELRSARRWIGIGPESWGLRLQPSELVKLALPVFLATWATTRADVRRFWTGLLPAVAVVAGSAVGVGVEDFGTAALIGAVAGAVLLVAGARWWHAMLLVLPAVPAFGYLLMSRSHRLDRLWIFLDIWRDPEGKGYQAIQSLCTIASGGLAGRGLGAGLAKGYLPAARNDFIYAVLCEELGLVGAIAVVGLLLVLVWQGGTVIRYCADPMGRLLAFGIVLTIGLQAAMNIAVVTVSVPTKGISLPLVSAGGSGAILMGAMVGVLASVARSGQDVRSQK